MLVYLLTYCKMYSQHLPEENCVGCSRVISFPERRPGTGSGWVHGAGIVSGGLQGVTAGPGEAVAPASVLPPLLFPSPVGT